MLPISSSLISGRLNPVTIGNLICYVLAGVCACMIANYIIKNHIPVNNNTVWAHQLVTEKDEGISDCVLDDQGNIIICGSTEGNLFAAKSGFDDLFVCKYTPAGSLLWSKQFGTGDEDPFGVTVDSKRNIYIAGRTRGKYAEQNEGDYDGFVTKISPSGKIIWSRQFGSSSEDYCSGITIDSSDNIYVYGETRGILFKPGTEYASNEIFVAKYSPDGKQLWGVQMGSRESDLVSGMAVSDSGNLYLVGSTHNWFASSIGYDDDAFLLKLSSTGHLIWGRQFGDSYLDGAMDVAIGSNESIYICGILSGDGFVAKYTPSGNRQWFREVPGDFEDDINNIAISNDGSIIAAGVINDNNIGPFIISQVYDVLVVKLRPDGKWLSRYRVRSPGDDWVSSLALDKQGYVYIAGSTYSSFFAKHIGGDEPDAYVAKLKKR